MAGVGTWREAVAPTGISGGYLPMGCGCTSGGAVGIGGTI